MWDACGYSSHKRTRLLSNIARRLPPPFRKRKRDIRPRRAARCVISQSTSSANTKRHLAVPALAEEVGFEPTRRVNGLRDFESRLLDLLSTPPYAVAVADPRRLLYYSTLGAKLQRVL